MINTQEIYRFALVICLLNKCNQNTTSLSLLADRTVLNFTAYRQGYIVQTA